MMQKPCAYCGDMTDMPFECNYCKDPFCPEHRLPEDHRCVKLTQIRSKKFGDMVTTVFCTYIFIYNVWHNMTSYKLVSKKSFEAMPIRILDNIIVMSKYDYFRRCDVKG